MCTSNVSRQNEKAANELVLWALQKYVYVLFVLLLNSNQSLCTYWHTGKMDFDSRHSAAQVRKHT